ncbi:MAG: GH25 family lysozyme [Sporolactobacillus sp.]
MLIEQWNSRRSGMRSLPGRAADKEGMESLKKIQIMAAFVLELIFSCLFAFPVSALPRADFVDVSHWNSQTGLSLATYQMLKASGIHAVVVKVSEGESYVDPAAAVNIANARTAGLRVSAYHFARFTSVSSARQEAQWFNKQLEYVGFHKAEDGIVTVDTEVATADPTVLTAAINAFIQAMNQLGYSTVDVYSSHVFYQSALESSNLAISYPWIARYNGGVMPPSVNYGAWQWSSDYQFNGISGRFDVSEDRAGKYSGATGAPTAGRLSHTGAMGAVSIVDWLQQRGKPWNYSYRLALAKQYGVMNYRGTASQNLALLAMLKSGIKPILSRGAAAASAAYTVRYGDTLSGIAHKYGVAVQWLVWLNGIRHADRIFAGERLQVSMSRAYTVHRGDSLWKIARQLGTTVMHLKTLNGLRTDLIYPGERLMY